jgi:hypothetical protein
VSTTVLYMSMSLDRFVAGPNEGPGNPLGDGGHRLHEWFSTGADADHKGAAGRLAGVNGEIVDEMMATGTVVATARRVIDSNQFMTIGTADDEGVPWVSPVWYTPVEYREFFWVSVDWRAPSAAPIQLRTDHGLRRPGRAHASTPSKRSDAEFVDAAARLSASSRSARTRIGPRPISSRPGSPAI